MRTTSRWSKWHWSWYSTRLRTFESNTRECEYGDLNHAILEARHLNTQIYIFEILWCSLDAYHTRVTHHFYFFSLLIQETKVRLETREMRESWGRMDHQDFQVSSIHQSITYLTRWLWEMSGHLFSHRNAKKAKQDNCWLKDCSTDLV